jgi:hypothetical protein
MIVFGIGAMAAGFAGIINAPVVSLSPDMGDAILVQTFVVVVIFSKVTITYIAISGQTDDVSLGIDRSSLGIVWQQYVADKVDTEYGHCRPARASD